MPKFSLLVATLIGTAFSGVVNPALAIDSAEISRANADFFSGHLSEARSDCDHIIDTGRISLNHLDHKTIRLFLNRTACDVALNENSKDLQQAGKVLTTLEKYLRSDRTAGSDKLYADCLFLRAEIAYRNGDNKNAQALYKKSYEFYLEKYGKDSPPLSNALEGMAVCQRNLGALDEAVASERLAAFNDFYNLGLASYRFCETLRYLVQLEYQSGNNDRAHLIQDLLVTSLRAGMADFMLAVYDKKVHDGDVAADQWPSIKARINRVIVGTVTPAMVREKMIRELGVNRQAAEQNDGQEQVLDFDTWISSRKQATNPAMLVRMNPLVPQKALIYCIHGLGLHGANFDAFSQKMADLGYPVLMPDIRGFGSNTHSKGLDKFEPQESLLDIYRSLGSLKQLTPDLPVILLGESMGGALALQSASAHQELVAALVCSVPSGSRFGGLHDSMRVARGILEGKNQIDVGKMIVHKATKDKESQERWEQDPKARLTMSPKELVHFQEFMDQNGKAARALDKLSVLFLQGAQDGLVKPMGTASLYGDLVTKDKDFWVLGSEEHLIFEDENCPAWISGALGLWIDEKLNRQKLYNPK